MGTARKRHTQRAALATEVVGFIPARSRLQAQPRCPCEPGSGRNELGYRDVLDFVHRIGTNIHLRLAIF